MRFTRFVSEEDIEDLKTEVVSQGLKVYLTRVLDSQILPDDLLTRNLIVNKSRNLVGLPIHVLTGYIEGYEYPTAEAWHSGEFMLIFRRLDAVQFAELVCELIDEGFFTVDQINHLLERDGLSFRIQSKPEGIEVRVFPIQELKSIVETTGHHNIRYLISRMDNALSRGDYAEVLHASACVFETMAKDIVGISTIQDQTLKSFFERYRKESLLLDAVLDYILSVYNRRSATPLAGHGSTKVPSISKEEAVTLVGVTRAFVFIEYKLQQWVVRTDSDVS